MNLVRIHGNMAPLLWPAVEGHLRDAILMSNGDHTPDTVFQEVISQEMQLWGIFSDEGECAAAVTTCLRQFSTGLIRCEIVHCGGEDMASWIHLLPNLENWARSQGCSGIRLIGRKGWGKILVDYAESAVVLEKRWPLVGARQAAHSQVMQ